MSTSAMPAADLRPSFFKATAGFLVSMAAMLGVMLLAAAS